MPASLEKRPRATPKADCLLHGDAHCTARESLRGKSAGENLGKSIGDSAEIDGDDEKCANDIEQRHHGHDFFRHAGNTLYAAQKNKTGRCCNEHTDHERWNAEALRNAAPIELDCTIFPIKPSAQITSTEKIPASTLPKRPLNAARI